MADDMPPFGGCNDPHVKQSLDWILSFTDPVDLRDRLELIDQNVFDSPGRQPEFRQVGYDHQRWPNDDRMGWYIYLALAALERPINYEPREGCRIIPIFKRFGTHLTELKAIGGVDQRVRRLLAKNTKQPDAILFELLVALTWKINGFQTVEFLQETPHTKTPDLRASNNADEWFIECKRLDRDSQYTRKERVKWRSMWSHLSDCLVRDHHSVVLDIRFHVELQSLPDDYLASQLPGKLKLVQPPSHIVSNDTMDVTVTPVDYGAANRHLARYSVRCPSDQLDELVGGQRDPNRGFSAIVNGVFQDIDNAPFLDHLDFAAAAFWNCDAPNAVFTKARHVRHRLANAIDQLPATGKGAVHIGLETVDGAMVEEARFILNNMNVTTIDPRGKDLRWVCCHLLQFYSPPQDPWVVDETVSQFSSDGAPPLLSPEAFLSDESILVDGMHWHRPPP